MITKIIVLAIIYMVTVIAIKQIATTRQNGILSIVYKVMIFGLITGITCVSILSALILSEVNSTVNDHEQSDYIVILGAGLVGDQVSDRLKIRLDTAIEIIKKSNAVIIVSGGQGPSEEISEAEAMRRYLQKQGVSENRIIKEEESTSTQENIKYSNAIMHSENSKVIIVTSDYHMYRAKMLGERIGWTVSGQSGENNTAERLRRMIREIFALAKDIIVRVY